MLLDRFDYHLPVELIAQHPLVDRDSSKMMVLNRSDKSVTNDVFLNLSSYLREGDVLVINDTRVIPARFFGKRESGGKVEILLLKRMYQDTWEVLVKPGRNAPCEEVIVFLDGLLRGVILEKTKEGSRIVKFESSTDLTVDEIIDKYGQMPLPHYIKDKLEDKERYQTIYSHNKGSVAAPTAGLHFTEKVFDLLKKKGVKTARLTLHVGLGTFRPVKTETIEEHVMHSEYYSVSKECANIINDAVRDGKRVVAVGTTSVRTLETVMAKEGRITESSGWTDIFIYPGYEFKAVDAMLTNFHLPKSTLLMLISAFSDVDFVLDAYKTAVDLEYRFFSFGDAMLII